MVYETKGFFLPPLEFIYIVFNHVFLSLEYECLMMMMLIPLLLLVKYPCSCLQFILLATTIVMYSTEYNAVEVQ
jgi:hypothetical protein